MEGVVAYSKWKKFEDAFIESMEESLLILLDESAKEAFFSYLEREFTFDGIIQNPGILSEELKKVFGIDASKIEKLIIALLYSKLRLEYEEKEGYKFEDYINYARIHGISYMEFPRIKRILDQRDLKIIFSLCSDGRKTITRLSKDTGLSRPTVTNRLDKLMKQNILKVKACLNIKELEFPIVIIALEIYGRELRQRLEKRLIDCPRALILLRPAEKANLLAIFYGENQGTLRSTIESIVDQTGVNLVYAHYSDPPLFPEHFNLQVFPQKGDVTPCGLRCIDCPSYKRGQCLGCPAVVEYKGPL